MAIPDQRAYTAFEQGTHVPQPLVLQCPHSRYYCPQCWQMLADPHGTQLNWPQLVAPELHCVRLET